MRPAIRRANETFAFHWRGMAFTATFSRFDDGRLAEIFLTNGKANTDADTAARDSAVVASLALQHGADVEILRGALLRDSSGEASGPLGCVMSAMPPTAAR
jgi:hypothetical protein